MSRSSSRRMLPALLLAGALVLAACGDDTGTGGGGGGGGGGGDGGTDVDLSGVSLSVGSKEFTEQLVLGQVLVQALEATGADVSDRTNLTGTAVVRQSLESGEIDLYYEYTGTGWITILGETEPVPGADEQFEAVREADVENGITWFARAEANNTFAIAANSQAVDELGVQSISDYAEVVNEDPSRGRLCSSAEFINRDDGLPGVEQTYGFDLPGSEVVQLEPALVYTQVGAGEDCDFAVVFATDGQILTQDLTVLEDDQDFFPPYNLAVTMRTEVYEENSEQFEELFGEISGELTDEKLTELNARVDVDGEDPRDVARDFLEEIGIL
jgi:osmoprotectant transport system substrate-binding protein